MRIATQLPDPPDPGQYTNDLHSWQRAIYIWMLNVKAQIEADSTVNTTPVAPLKVGTYTEVTTITGTDDVSNFVATLVAKMQQAGITSPTSQR